MTTNAILKNARISAQKCRLVADMIRGKEVSQAIDILNFSEKKASALLRKVLNSAIANAEHNDSEDVDTLKVHRLVIDEGSSMKRIRPRAKGRANRILKRTCHIQISLKAE